MGKIIITGGTGLVGQHLTQALLSVGHDIVHLSRHRQANNRVETYQWDITKGYIDPMVFDGVTSVVHLAGASIAGHRWTKSYKQELYESRIASTRLLVNFVQTNHISLESFVCASAVGIYGNNTGLFTTEEQMPGNDFLAVLCSDWEKEAMYLKDSTRVVILRTGVVLAKEAGFIPKVSKLIRMGAGSVLGNGRQYMSWVHIADLVALYQKVLEDTRFNGAYNAVAPIPETNKAIMYAMASVLHRPIILPPVPAQVLKWVLGEMSSAVLANQHTSNHKVEQTGFRFLYPELQYALRDLL